MNTTTYEISRDPATIREWETRGESHPLDNEDAALLETRNRAERRAWLKAHKGFKKGWNHE